VLHFAQEQCRKCQEHILITMGRRRMLQVADRGPLESSRLAGTMETRNLYSKGGVKNCHRALEGLPEAEGSLRQGLREYRDEASNSQSANPRARHGCGDRQSETVQCTQRSSDAALRGRDLARLLVRDTHRLRIKFPCRWFRFSLRT
jgi:hypothetical protein